MWSGGVAHLFLLYKTGCITKSIHFAASALSTAAPYSAKEISTLESMWKRVPTSGRCRLLVNEDWFMIQSPTNDSSIFYIQEITFFDATKCRTECLRYIERLDLYKELQCTGPDIFLVEIRLDY